MGSEGCRRGGLGKRLVVLCASEHAILCLIRISYFWIPMVWTSTESEYYGGDRTKFTLLAPLVNLSKTTTAGFHFQVPLIT